MIGAVGRNRARLALIAYVLEPLLLLAGITVSSVMYGFSTYSPAPFGAGVLLAIIIHQLAPDLGEAGWIPIGREFLTSTVRAAEWPNWMVTLVPGLWACVLGFIIRVAILGGLTGVVDLVNHAENLVSGVS